MMNQLALLALVGSVSSMILCPQMSEQDVWTKQLGETCGGACDVSGVCGDGLTCEEECNGVADPFPALMGAPKPEGLCVRAKSMSFAILAGAPLQQDVCDPGAQEAATEMAKAMDMQSNSMNSWQVVRVVGAKSQVVNGIMWHLEVVGGVSSCRKASDGTYALCETPVEDASKSLYTASVLKMGDEFQLMEFATVDQEPVPATPAPAPLIGGQGGLPPAWILNGSEAPACERDEGSWTSSIYCPEQMERLSVDEAGNAVAPSLGALGGPRGGHHTGEHQHNGQHTGEHQQNGQHTGEHQHNGGHNGGHSCEGGKVWKDCGSSCVSTCEDPSPICVEMCVAKCECPSDRPHWDATTESCIPKTECSASGQVGGHGGLPPAWILNGLEAPACERDEGSWTSQIYCAEQMERLSVDEAGNAKADPEPEHGRMYCFSRELWSDEKKEWCCEHMSLGCPATPAATSGKFGADRDEHDCVGTAGYRWCAALNKCIRPWEEGLGSAEAIRDKCQMEDFPWIGDDPEPTAEDSMEEDYNTFGGEDHDAFGDRTPLASCYACEFGSCGVDRLFFCYSSFDMEADQCSKGTRCSMRPTAPVPAPAERQPPCMGCVRTDDAQSEDARRVAAKGFALLLEARREENNGFDAELTDVTEYRKQVVAGMKYYVTTEVKVASPNVGVSFAITSQVVTCKMELWERTWLTAPDDFQMLSWDCGDVTSENTVVSSAASSAATSNLRADGDNKSVPQEQAHELAAPEESSGRSMFAGSAAVVVVAVVGVLAIAGVMVEKRRQASAATMGNRAQQMMVPLDQAGNIIANPSNTVEV